MIGLKTEFKSSSLAEWKDQLKKDLNGDDFSKLIKTNQIEEIEIPTFHHAESNIISPQSPGTFPFTRSYSNETNDWKNGFIIHVRDCKISNKKTLEILMKGCDHLIFDIPISLEIDWKSLLNEIQFEYITTNIKLRNVDQIKSLKNYFNDQLPDNLNLDLDLNELKENSVKNECISIMKGSNNSFIEIDGYSIQQCGATTWQEIGFCLSSAHENLVQLLDSGLTFNEAKNSIHFTIGVGSDFFYEIAKIRALRQTWSSILKEYDSKNEQVYNCKITAVIGFMNKSLSDPYTNLLRQTTEALSAASGGVDAIVIQPYDSHTQEGSTVFSERMALNISLILKEESYLSSVIDPLGGSYALENLTSLIADKAWNFFQNMESLGGINSSGAMEFLRVEIEKKAKSRLEEVQNNKRTLIGVNKFSNPNATGHLFLEPGKYMGMHKVIFEHDLINA